MSLDRNGRPCLHNVTDIDPLTNEEYCLECGDVIESDEFD